MILYIFQCHSPKSSYPLPLLQSPKDYSIQRCLFCCLAYRVIIAIFLPLVAKDFRCPTFVNQSYLLLKKNFFFQLCFCTPEFWEATALLMALTALNMPANLENSEVATGLEKVSFHSNPKERQCQRMLKLPYNCTHLTC